jgi:hypothetical protein
MGLPSRVERCPQCSCEGFRYDAVCHIWCCAQCQTTETPAEKAEREARATSLRAMAREGRASF